uniref:UBA domain-containing protein n=1 Tax=Kalanchoe fedtschenkoi TaxID=63787 RepID=A0A7N0T534_KALFE
MRIEAKQFQSRLLSQIPNPSPAAPSVSSASSNHLLSPTNSRVERKSMNPSSFMDKQIMDLSGASPKTNPNDFIDLISHPPRPIQHQDDDVDVDERHNLAKDHIQPSYDFQPIRPPPQSANYDHGPSRPWNSADSKSPNTSSPLTKNYGSLDSTEPAKGILAKDRNVDDGSILSEIDRTMKKYTDTVLHALEGVSARLTQLETRTRNLENSVDDIKVSVGNNHGTTDGKVRQLENILREVQTGVQVLRDKHEIIEAQLQVSKLQVLQTGQHSENLNSAGSSSVPTIISEPLQETAQQLVASVPQQAYQQPPPAALPPFPTSQNVAPPSLQSQTFVPQPQPPSQIPQNQIPHSAHYPPPGQTQEAPNQHYQHPPTQQPPPPPSSAPHQLYAGSYPSYSQPSQQHMSMPPVVPPQAQPPVNIRQEEAQYFPSQSYAPTPQQPLSQSSSAGTPSQQYYGPPSQVYDSPPHRSNLGYSSGYGAPTGPNEPYPYGASTQYGGGSKPQLAPSAGGGGYPQLPTARVLPQAIPTASAISGESGSSGTGNNRVPVDDVVDKVTSMGFSREQVRATVRRLTENGQSVDLNVVLDKLMNDSDVQPPKGWFGR